MPDVSQSTDQELLDRARGGDASAFRSLVERYEGQVASTVIGMLGYGPEADDVGQETFIRFYRAMENFRGDSSLGTYLTRIAINQSLKALKKRKNRNKRFQSAEENETSILEIVGDDDTTYADRERRDLIHKALEHLSPDHRAVVVLRMLDEYSTKETAELLGIAEGTVMSRLSRAMQKLEQLLRPVI